MKNLRIHAWGLALALPSARLRGEAAHGVHPGRAALRTCHGITRPLHLEPVGRWRELRAHPWPGDIGPVVMEGAAQDPPSTVAMTYSATAFAKRSGTTPEAIKSA
ncbi:uncharacterized protein STAUR_5997 [Stigmatella aurantiaca DW4/3-1]|uniref:Uncharacterized protein n=1 Tax=Stigmatella aurantiaca (strain DW4/3-1) TaxID=378806 RepID=E3G0J2_STIAD|nr:uncharacterized protein STAUR_5997 [Stigmatella aurantiaca DW4/3-1]